MQTCTSSDTSGILISQAMEEQFPTSDQGSNVCPPSVHVRELPVEVQPQSTAISNIVSSAGFVSVKEEIGSPGNEEVNINCIPLFPKSEIKTEVADAGLNAADSNHSSFVLQTLPSLQQAPRPILIAPKGKSSIAAQHIARPQTFGQRPVIRVTQGPNGEFHYNYQIVQMMVGGTSPAVGQVLMQPNAIRPTSSTGNFALVHSQSTASLGTGNFNTKATQALNRTAILVVRAPPPLSVHRPIVTSSPNQQGNIQLGDMPKLFSVPVSGNSGQGPHILEQSGPSNSIPKTLVGNSRTFAQKISVKKGLCPLPAVAAKKTNIIKRTFNLLPGNKLVPLDVSQDQKPIIKVRTFEPEIKQQSRQVQQDTALHIFASCGLEESTFDLGSSQSSGLCETLPPLNVTSAKKGQAKKPKPPPKPRKVFTPEEKAIRLEQRRRSQYATWTEPVKIEKFKEYFSDSEENEIEASDLENSSAVSDFQPEEGIMSSTDSDSGDSDFDLLDFDEEDLEIIDGDDLEKREKKQSSCRPEVKGPTSAFTIEIIADILQTPLEELDADSWNEKIKNTFDDKIFEEAIYLNRTTRRYKCFKCDTQIQGNVDDLTAHMKQVHTSELVFGCFFCPLARVSEKSLKFHERLHCHYNPKIGCTICDSFHSYMPHMPDALKDMDWRSLHFQHHPPIEDVATYEPEDQIIKASKCVTCEDRPHPPTGKRTGIRGFNDHLYMYHVDIQAVCFLCGDIMNAWKLRNRHLPLCKKRNQEGPFSCKKCGWTIKTYNSFMVHDCTGRYNCKICGAKFMYPNTLKRHKENVHGDIRRHTCHVCGKSFQEPMVLKDHLNTHTGEKPYQCLVCGTRHTSKAGLAMHLRSRHDLTTREMKEKYKNCPIPEPAGSDEEKMPKEKAIVQTENVLNPYTGRKRGRPRVKKTLEPGEEGSVKKVRKPRKKAQVNDSVDVKEENDDGEDSKPKRRRKPRKKPEPSGEGSVKKRKVVVRKPKVKKRNTSSDSDEEEEVASDASKSSPKKEPSGGTDSDSNDVDKLIGSLMTELP